jgi:hypothetical protein
MTYWMDTLALYIYKINFFFKKSYIIIILITLSFSLSNQTSCLIKQ